MAEDNMEISSDFGGRVGEEDIDIDFDFAPNHHDEDQMLEDVISEADIDTKVQSSPAAVHDDVMVDEDIASIPMNDADFTQDQLDTWANFQQASGDMASLNTGVEGAEVNEENVLSAEAHKDEPPNPKWTEAESSAQLTDIYPAETQDSSPDQSELIPGTENESVAPFPPHGQEPAPQSSANKEVASGAEEEAQPPNSAPQGDESLQNHQGDSSELVGTTDNDIGQPQDEPTKSQAIGSNKVVVVYQSAEYSLVRLSDMDDPDSFFLNDDALLHEPLPKLFDGLRDVLGDEISPDDELCLVIDDLGLETSETSNFIYALTLSQIVDLIGNLHRNDGTSNPGSLYVSLNIKPNFIKRYSSLAKGAAEGKGLSELVQWDDGSLNCEGLNGSGDGNAELEEYDHADEHTGEDQEEEYARVQEEESRRQIESETKISEQLQVEDDEILPTETSVSKDDSRDVPHEPVENPPPSRINEISHTDAQLEEKGKEDHEDFDEDGDLIDYEDEEYEHNHNNATSAESNGGGSTEDGTFADLLSPCLKPGTCFCSQCNEVLLAEYEAINEEFRRQSFSRRARDSLSDSYQVTISSAATNKYLEVPAAGTSTHETEIAATTTNDADQGTVDAEGHDEDTINQYEDDQHDGSPDIDHPTEQSSTIGHEVIQDDGNVSEIDFEQDFEENLESLQSNESDNTLVGDAAVVYDEIVGETHDEIDYDEDDRLEFGANSDHNPEKEHSISNGPTGKRSREAEDTVDEELKESKRVRS